MEIVDKSKKMSGIGSRSRAVRKVYELDSKEAMLCCLL